MQHMSMPTSPRDDEFAPNPLKTPMTPPPTIPGQPHFFSSPHSQAGSQHHLGNGHARDFNGNSNPVSPKRAEQPVVDSITLLSKFSNNAVFFAGEKLSCTFTFIPPGYQQHQRTQVPPFLQNRQSLPDHPKPFANNSDLSQRQQHDTEYVLPPVTTSDPSVQVHDPSNTRKEQGQSDDKSEGEEEHELVKASEIQRRLTLESTHHHESPTETAAGSGGLLSWLWPFSSPTTTIAPVEMPKMVETKPLEDRKASLEHEIVPSSSTRHLELSVNAVNSSDIPAVHTYKSELLFANSGMKSPDIIAGAESNRKIDAYPSLRSINGSPSAVGIDSRQFSRIGSMDNINNVDAYSFARRGSVNSMTAETAPDSSVYERSWNTNTYTANHNIALAFVQLVGYMSYDPSFMSLPEETLATRDLLKPSNGGGLSLSEMNDFITNSKAIPVLVSKPTIIFANLDLVSAPLNGRKRPRKRTFNFEAVLPPLLPPTHRGRACRVQYRLIIGIQKSIYDKPNFIHLPFRVFSYIHENGAQTEYISSDPSGMSKSDTVAYCIEDERDLAAAKRHEKKATADFLTMLKHGSSDESAYHTKSSTMSKLPDNRRGRTLVHVIQLTEQSQKTSFDICKNNSHITHFKLAKTVYGLGDVINASLDFAKSKIKCFHVSVYLECLENIVADVCVRSKGDTDKLTKRVASEQHETCLHVKKMPISLCIPAGGTPEFSSDLVSVAWQLRIEFVTQKGSDDLFALDENVAPPIYFNLFDQQKKEKSQSQSQQLLDKSLIGNTDNEELADIGEATSQLPFTYKLYRTQPETHVESFDCIIPIRVYSCDWENGRLYPHKQKFVMVNAGDDIDEE